MKATVVKINWKLPTCEAKTSNDLLIVFRPPEDEALMVGDMLELDLNTLGVPQTAANVSRATSHKLILRRNDIHDLKLPMGHETNRFPSPQRFNETLKS